MATLDLFQVIENAFFLIIYSSAKSKIQEKAFVQVVTKQQYFLLISFKLAISDRMSPFAILYQPPSITGTRFTKSKTEFKIPTPYV